MLLAHQFLLVKWQIYIYGMVQRQNKGPFCPYDWGISKRYSDSCEHKGGPLTACLCSFILHLLICVWECVYVREREKKRECESMCMEVSEQYIWVISLLYHVGSEDIKPESPGLAANVCTFWATSLALIVFNMTQILWLFHSEDQ